jgi:predicted MFS family arabinose efflux permease
VTVVAISAQGAVLSGLVSPLLESRGYSLAAIGLLVATSAVVALLSRLPGGLLYASDRARWLLLGALGLGAVASALHPLASDAAAFAVVRALTGASYGVATTVNLAVFTEGLPAGAARQRGLGYYTAGIAIGYSTGAYLAGLAADLVGLSSAFWLAVGFGLLALVGVPWDGASPRGAAKPDEPFRWQALGQRRLAAVMAICFSLFLTFSYWNAYLPLYALAVGLTLGDVGVIRGAFGLCQVVARPAGGFAVGRVGASRLTFTGLLIQSAMLLLVPLATTLPLLLVIFVANGATRALAIVSNAVELVEASEEARVSRGVMAGAYNTAMDLGTLTGPALGGLIANAAGLPASFVAVPLLAFAIGLATLVAHRARPRPVVVP